MAKNYIPVFAVGKYDSIPGAIASGELTYPAYVFCSDTNTMVFVDKNLQMRNLKGFGQSSSYEDLNDIPIQYKRGEVGNSVILADLEDGCYLVTGQYQIGGSVSTTFITAKRVLFLVSSDDTYKFITKLGAEEILRYKIRLETGEGTIENALSVTRVSQLENDSGYLTANDIRALSTGDISSLF